MEHGEKVQSLVLVGAQYKMPKGLLKFQNIIFRFMPGAAFAKMGIQKDDVIKSIPFIILTAKGQENDIKTGEDLGMDDYITKPFSMKALLEKVAEILGE